MGYKESLPEGLEELVNVFYLNVVGYKGQKDLLVPGAAACFI